MSVCVATACNGSYWLLATVAATACYTLLLFVYKSPMKELNRNVFLWFQEMESARHHITAAIQQARMVLTF